MKRWCLALGLAALASCSIVEPSDRGAVDGPSHEPDASDALDAGSDAASDAGPDAAR